MNLNKEHMGIQESEIDDKIANNASIENQIYTL